MKEKNYIVAYTLFSYRFKSGFHTFYKHFDKLEHAIRFSNNPNIKDNCMIYESIDKMQEIESRK